MSKPRHKKFYKKVQLITIDHNGHIIHTDANLFSDWEIGDILQEEHPFFEIINSLLLTYSPDHNEFTFPCVHLSTDLTEEKICDITITIEFDEINIVIFDYTKTYEELNLISQERNESLLELQQLEFSNKLLIEKENFKNQFIANVNHEITTPVTSIKGFLDLLEKTDLSYQQEELIKIIKDESEHLLRIFNDMIDLSKIESGTFKLIKEPFNIIDLFNSIAESFKEIIKEKALDFKFEIDPNIEPNVVGDKTRIYQIIGNLLNNAIKYTEQGYIKFEIQRLEGIRNRQNLKIIIEDTGQGIEDKHKDSIFDPFVQHNEKGEGTGLGLHIVKNLILMMKGEIHVESKVDEGTTFILNLSLAHQKENDQTEETKYKLPENTEKKFRVLIVENKRNTQYLITRQLLNQKIFFVDVVPSAEEAINIIESRNYDLLILDIKLPGMSGFELAKKIRNNYSDSFISNVPILGISAVNSFNNQKLWVESGIDSFISKPFTEELLIEKIAKLFSRKEKTV